MVDLLPYLKELQYHLHKGIKDKNKDKYQLSQITAFHMETDKITVVH